MRPESGRKRNFRHNEKYTQHTGDDSSSSGQLLSREAMRLFAASCRLIASTTPRALGLLVNLVCFDVCSRTASKTGSPCRSFFCNCLM